VTIRVAGDTHQGRFRTNNEDNLLIAEVVPGLQLLLVADGVGGHSCGEVASQIVVDAFSGLIADGKLDLVSDLAMRQPLLEMAVQRAHIEVARQAQSVENCKGMACALTVAIVDEHSVAVAQVGDTRLYQWSQAGGLSQCTDDQTIAADRVARGQISAQDAEQHPDRNVLSQAVGLELTNAPLRPVISTLEWAANTRLLLCSDGLSNMVSDSGIHEILAQNLGVDATVEALIQAALDSGGRDNITAIVASRSN
jgi:serine/threonine protein phosphatase PrpC